jgi:hypothetical protein
MAKEDTQFKPGKSPNPGGRPKRDPVLKGDCKALTPIVLDRLHDIIVKGKDRDAIAAGKIVLEYAWGKPTQTIAGDPDRPLAFAGLAEQVLQELRGGKE